MIEHVLRIGLGQNELRDVLAALLLSAPLLAIIGAAAPLVPAAGMARAGMIWLGMRLQEARQPLGG